MHINVTEVILGVWPETEQSWVSIVGLVGRVDKYEASSVCYQGCIRQNRGCAAQQDITIWDTLVKDEFFKVRTVHTCCRTVTFHQSTFPSPYLFFYIQRKEEIFQKGNKFFHTIPFYYVFIEFLLQENMLARLLMLFINVCFFCP